MNACEDQPLGEYCDVTIARATSLVDRQTLVLREIRELHHEWRPMALPDVHDHYWCAFCSSSPRWSGCGPAGSRPVAELKAIKTVGTAVHHNGRIFRRIESDAWCWRTERGADFRAEDVPLPVLFVWNPNEDGAQ